MNGRFDIRTASHEWYFVHHHQIDLIERPKISFKLLEKVRVCTLSTLLSCGFISTLLFEPQGLLILESIATLHGQP